MFKATALLCSALAAVAKAWAFSNNPAFVRTTTNRAGVLNTKLLAKGMTANGDNNSEESLSPDDLPFPVLDPDSGETFNTTTTNLEDQNGWIKLKESPQLSFEKYMTMQDKRVIVTVRYSAARGLKPYFLTLAKKLKASHPDVMIERRILADIDEEEFDEATFEVLVDGKSVLGRGKKQRAGDQSVFVSMQELDLAISRARRRRRPSTTYGTAK